MTLQSYYHTSVTSYDMVTVTVTNHEAIEKDVEGSRKMTLYNMYYIC